MEAPIPPIAGDFVRKRICETGYFGPYGRFENSDKLSTTSRTWTPSGNNGELTRKADRANCSSIYLAAEEEAPGADRRQPKPTYTDAAWKEPSDPSPCSNSLAAFTEASERCRGKFLWIATRVTRRTEDAEDIVQTALLKAFENLSRFRGEARMSTWLSVIVLNTAREYRRQRFGKVFVSLDSPPSPNSEGDTLDLPEPLMNPEECFEKLERVKILSAAVERLSSLYRDTLQLCIFEETPYVRVATALKVRVSTVKSRVLRSKRALKVALITGSRTDK